MSGELTVVTVGETLVRYGYGNNTVINDEKYCAGAESNVAANIQTLGIPSVQTVWVSRLGNDPEGSFIREQLEGRIRVFAKAYTGQRTGTFYVKPKSGGGIEKVYDRKESAASRMEFEDLEPFLSNATLLHVTGITPALSDSCQDMIFQSLAYAREHSIPVSFDVNYRDALWTPREALPVFEKMLGYTSIFKVGYDEAIKVWGRDQSIEPFADAFYHDNLVVITDGHNGSVAYDGTNFIRSNGYKVEVKDVVGAGDAFVAGLLGSLLMSGSIDGFFQLVPDQRRTVLERSMKIANACGAITCTKMGDIEGMPTLNEVSRFLEERIHEV